MPGDQVNRRRLAAAGRAAKRRQHGAERPVAVPLNQQPHRHERHPRGAWAAQLKGAVRSVGQGMVEVEGRWVHGVLQVNTPGWIC